jgi:hypothetical protein
VSAAAIRADAPAAASGAAANPWLIAVIVALASFMEVLDTTIANVALPYIAGGMGVSEDEASWVVTTYLVSNAVILTASPFLARMLGRKTFFLISLGLFTLSSLLCGYARPQAECQATAPNSGYLTSVEAECENPETNSTGREGANTWVFGAAPGNLHRAATDWWRTQSQATEASVCDISGN